MEKILQKFAEGIADVEEMIKKETSVSEVTPERRLRGAIDEFRQGCEGYIRLVRGSNSDRSRVGKNKLDKERNKLLLLEMENMIQRSRMLRRSLKAETLKDRLARSIEMREKISRLLEDPQDTLPDIFIWMLVNKKRIAYARLPARRVIYSIVEEECGKDCSKIQTLFLTLPGHRGIEDRTIQAKLEIYMWLGLTKHRRNYMGGLPIGYNLPTHMSNNGHKDLTQSNSGQDQPPPPFITYREKQEFMLRAHLFQARGLVAADDSGLSDPFAKVIFSSEVATTYTIRETLNPNWDQTLVLGPIAMYGRPEEFKQDPPLVIIEVFDEDQGGKSEFVGRTVAKPNVKMTDESYLQAELPNELDWFQIYCGRSRCGELLASFELIQIPYEEDEIDHALWDKWSQLNDLPFHQNTVIPQALDTRIMIENQNVIRVPRGIRPILIKHRVEILFWGLRELKRIQMIPIQHPRVDIEIAGRTISSSVIMNFRKCPNFIDNIKFLEDIELPDNWYWCPPISIKVVDCRTFGREQLIGTHICHNLSKFKYPQAVPTIEEIKANRKLRQDALGHGGIASMGTSGFKGDNATGHSHNAPNGGAESSVGDTDTKKGGFKANVTMNPFDAMSNVGGPSINIDNTVAIQNDGDEDGEDNSDEPQLDWWSKYFASYAADYDDDGEFAVCNLDNRNPGKTNIRQSSASGVSSATGMIASKGVKGKEVAAKVTKTSVANQVHRLNKYYTELENHPDYDKFADLLQVFELRRGKGLDSVEDEIDDQKRVAGYFKGSFRIYRMPMPKGFEKPDPIYGTFRGMPGSEPVKVIARIYIIRCTDLHPCDANGKADPYIVIKLGQHTIKDADNYVSKQLNPTFGRAFELEITFPIDSLLRLEYMSVQKHLVIYSVLIQKMSYETFSPYPSKYSIGTSLPATTS